MSLTRKQLSDWGITGETADLIINAHVETVNAVKTERDEYASKSVELADALAELEEAKTYKSDMEKYRLEAETAIAAKAALEKQIQEAAETSKKDDALAKFLKAEGFHPLGINKIVKYSAAEYREKIKLTEMGGIENIDEMRALTTSEWGEFKGKTEKFEHIPGNQPNNRGGFETPSRARAIAEQIHDNLYGSIK